MQLTRLTRSVERVRSNTRVGTREQSPGRYLLILAEAWLQHSKVGGGSLISSLVVSDEHRGIKSALRRYFPEAIWQRCQTHYQRNAKSKVPR